MHAPTLAQARTTTQIQSESIAYISVYGTLSFLTLMSGDGPGVAIVGIYWMRPEPSCKTYLRCAHRCPSRDTAGAQRCLVPKPIFR